MTTPTNSIEITPQTPVGRIAVARPSSIPVFQRLGIDFCCHGTASLTEAAEQAGASVNDVLGELLALPAAAAEDATDWNSASLVDLVEHIVSTHHAYTKSTLPALWELLGKVIQVHGENHPELHQVGRVVAALFTELGQHLQKEEQVLFPHIRELSTNPEAPRVIPDGPMNVMEQEHDNAGRALKELRELTNGFAPPSDACDAYRSLFSGLAELERDLHLHIHLENNILHPRTRALV